MARRLLLSSLDPLRREALWTSRRRDWMEMTYLLNGFVERHLVAFSDEEVAKLLELLKRKDHELHPWLAARAEVPAELLHNEA